jgi:hypothetical protein
MITVFQSIVLILVWLGMIKLCFIWKEYFKHKKYIETRLMLYNNTEYLMVILNQILGYSYQIIYQKEILVHQINNNKMSNEEVNKLRLEFIKMVMEFLGKNILRDLIELYGDYDSVMNFIANDFNEKYYKDEVQVKDELLSK